MVDEFCGSLFSCRKKRVIFFPDHFIECRTYHKPRVKRLINLEDFSVRHQKLICMFGQPHGRVPAAGTIAALAGGTTAGGTPAWGIPPAGGTPPAAGTIATRGTPAAIVPSGGGVPSVPVFHAGHGPHINPL